ncbi:MAG: hypothetical protein FJW39_33820 [Acidobacteria bacterium]|nr:hypothetical protein [Acidobacteriota bacterium]
MLLLALAAAATVGQVPPTFEPNLGQAPPRVRYLARAPNYQLHLEPDQFALRTLAAQPEAEGPLVFDFARMRFPQPAVWTELALRWLGARTASIAPEASTGARTHYFRPRLRISAPQFEKVRYRDLYQGIDLVVYGTGPQFEYDFEVAPHADPSQIHLEFRGARSLRLSSDGDLILDTPAGPVLHKRPRAFQGSRPVEAAYRVLPRHGAAIELGRYDPSLPLTIDPVIYITYLGGSGTDRVFGSAADRNGNTYFTGTTTSTDFRTQNPLQAANAGGATDTWVVKLDAQGRRLYSTYFGGSGQDDGNRIRVDLEGNAYVSGTTRSSDFPTTPDAHQRERRGDSDAYLFKLSPNGDQLLYSTLLGGSGDDTAPGLLVDLAGAVCVAGSTTSTDLPATADAVQRANAGGSDAYAAIFDPSGALAYLTYFGGAGTDTLAGIALGQGGNLYFTGLTTSTNFPVAGEGAVSNLRGPTDAYLVRLSSNRRSALVSTLIGGSREDGGTDVAVLLDETVLVSGNTRSPDFPLTTPAAPGSIFPAQTIFAVQFQFPRGGRPPDRFLASSLPAESGSKVQS